MMPTRETLRVAALVLLAFPGCEDSSESGQSAADPLAVQQLPDKQSVDPGNLSSQQSETDQPQPAQPEIPVLPDGEAADGGLSIAQIMNLAHDNKFYRELYRDDPDPGAVQFLADLYDRLATQTPSSGDQEDWAKRVAALVSSVDEIEAGHPDGLAQFKRAVNCNSCHSRHRS